MRAAEPSRGGVRWTPALAPPLPFPRSLPWLERRRQFSSEKQGILQTGNIAVVENSVRMRRKVAFIDRHSRVRGNQDLDSCDPVPAKAGSANDGRSHSRPDIILVRCSVREKAFISDVAESLSTMPRNPPLGKGTMTLKRPRLDADAFSSVCKPAGGFHVQNPVLLLNISIQRIGARQVQGQQNVMVKLQNGLFLALFCQ
jgi:hypothetical protein